MTRKGLKTKADKLFSQWVRSAGKCEWCGRSYGVQLQCAHIFSRRFLITRWLEINAVCLCAGCHRKGHDKPIEFVEWVREHLGDDVYEELRRLAKTGIYQGSVEDEITKYKQLLEVI